MFGSRTRILFLSLFFSFAFALSFLALSQNYANASTPSTASLSPMRIFALRSDVAPSREDSVLSEFSLLHSVAAFDFDSDDSFQKYLSTDHPFSNLSYTPLDLLPINSHFAVNDVSKFKLREEAGIAFADMAWQFWHDFDGDRLSITSAYRSKSFQDFLVKRGCLANTCAQAGTSEHQAGLALDLKIVSKGGRAYSLDVTGKPNKYYDWLKNNAAKFGFHNTYQKGVVVDGKVVEGRHRRYMGVELATLLADNNQTFAEYYTTIDNEKGIMNNE